MIKDSVKDLIDAVGDQDQEGFLRAAMDCYHHITFVCPGESLGVTIHDVLSAAHPHTDAEKVA